MVEPAPRVEPVRSTGETTRPLPAQPTGVLGDYQQVRANPDPREIERFDSLYHYTRISCINFDELRSNPGATLRFQEAQRGALLVVSQGNQNGAFPWFATDLLHERERLEGIFQFYDNGQGNLRLTKPARLLKQGSEWTLAEAGIVQSDG